MVPFKNNAGCEKPKCPADVFRISSIEEAIMGRRILE